MAPHLACLSWGSRVAAGPGHPKAQSCLAQGSPALTLVPLPRSCWQPVKFPFPCDVSFSLWCFLGPGIFPCPWDVSLSLEGFRRREEAKGRPGAALGTQPASVFHSSGVLSGIDREPCPAGRNFAVPCSMPSQFSFLFTWVCGQRTGGSEGSREVLLLRVCSQYPL